MEDARPIVPAIRHSQPVVVEVGISGLCDCPVYFFYHHLALLVTFLRKHYDEAAEKMRKLGGLLQLQEMRKPTLELCQFRHFVAVVVHETDSGWYFYCRPPPDCYK